MSEQSVFHPLVPDPEQRCYAQSMSMDAREVLEAALRLPAEARAKLAGQLLESLENEDAGEVDRAWASEIERRIADVDSGRAKTVSWSEVREELREIVRNPRGR